MTELDRYLTANFEDAFDRYDSQMRDFSPTSLEDIKRMFPATMEMVLSQWAASLDIQTNHELIKASIDAIR